MSVRCGRLDTHAKSHMICIRLDRNNEACASFIAMLSHMCFQKVNLNVWYLLSTEEMSAEEELEICQEWEIALTDLTPPPSDIFISTSQAVSKTIMRPNKAKFLS